LEIDGLVGGGDVGVVGVVDSVGPVGLVDDVVGADVEVVGVVEGGLVGEVGVLAGAVGGVVVWEEGGVVTPTAGVGAGRTMRYPASATTKKATNTIVETRTRIRLMRSGSENFMRQRWVRQFRSLQGP
jgi:hypothetical protein